MNHLVCFDLEDVSQTLSGFTHHGTQTEGLDSVQKSSSDYFEQNRLLKTNPAENIPVA